MYEHARVRAHTHTHTHRVYHPGHSSLALFTLWVVLFWIPCTLPWAWPPSWALLPRREWGNGAVGSGPHLSAALPTSH